MSGFKNKLALADTLQRLSRSGKEFEEYFKHGSLVVELYKPEGVDKQQPHERDEVYIIATGAATFRLENETTDVAAGDFLFVPAGKEHRFEQFTKDFSTWVLFYGPAGGEQA